MGGRWTRSVVAAVALLFGAAVGTPAAQAHWADQAAAEVVVSGATARMTLTVPTGLLAPIVGSRAGRLSTEEIRTHRDALERFLSERVRLVGRYPAPRPAADAAGPTGGKTGGAAVESAGVLTLQPEAGTPSGGGPGGLPPATHTTLTLVYTWPAPIEALTIRYDLFAPGVSTASCLVTVLQGGRVQNVAFTPEHRETVLGFGETPVWRALGGFVALGINHILTGYDHMLFLLSLLMLGGGLGSLLKIVTAFTVAHSMTLSLAVLGAVALPSRWVESAIALSITYVAAENVLRGSASIGRRWLVTFGFGLVHGLGFASALQEMHLPRANIAASIVGFNLGVEIGQVAVVALAFFALDAIRRYQWTPAFQRWVSVATACTGLFWFVQRFFFTS